MKPYPETSKKDKDPDSSTKYNYSFWVSQIKTAKDEAKIWREECKTAWSEYLAKDSVSDESFRKRYASQGHYPQYWSDTQTIKPAIYSNLPQVVVKQRFSSDDPVARTAALIAERLGTYLVEQTNLNDAINKAALEFLNCNRATTRIYYEAEIEERVKRVPVREMQVAPDLPEPEIDPETGFPIGPEPELDEQGQPIPPQPITIYVIGDEGAEEEVAQEDILIDDQGMMYVEIEGETEEVNNECLKLKALTYEDMIISPNATSNSEIWWVAYKIKTSKHEAIERFGAEKAEQLKTDTSGKKSKKQKQDDLTCEYWEIWCKRTKKVYWLSETANGELLDEQDDIYEIENFFPSPKFVIDSVATNSFYPIPEYSQTWFLYRQLHLLAARIYKLSKAIRSRFVFDGAIPELQNLGAEIYEAEGIGVADFSAITDKGGIQNLVQFWPVGDLARALQQCQQLFEQYKAQIYEIRGIPDIIRGATDPGETAFAQRIKSRYASLRFSYKQRSFAEFIAENIRLLVDSALALFSDETIENIVGKMHMDKEDQDRFAPALTLLQSDKQRNIRIDIETDSTVLWIEEEQKAIKAEMLQAVSGYVKELRGVIKEDPEFAGPLTALLYSYIKEMRQGKEIQDEVSQSFDALLEKLNAPKDDQPDPKQIVEQTKLQVEQIKSQTALQKAAMDAQIVQMKGDIEQLALQIKGEDIQLGREQVQRDYAKMGQETQVAQLETNADAFKAQSQMQKEEIDTQQALIRADADKVKAQAQVISSQQSINGGL